MALAAIVWLAAVAAAAAIIAAGAVVEAVVGWRPNSITRLAAPIPQLDAVSLSHDKRGYRFSHIGSSS